MNRKLLAALLMLSVVGISAVASAQESQDAAVEIENFAFGPDSITVTVGTNVTWTNMDESGHTVTSDDGDFDSGDLWQNDTFSFTFETAGTYAYHCTPHPGMTGTITVTDPAPDDTEPVETPGFGLLVGLLSLSVVAIALRPRD